MKIDIDIEEEIDILWDQGKKDIILTLKQATESFVAFRINFHMDLSILLQLQKEINEFLKGEI